MSSTYTYNCQVKINETSPVYGIHYIYSIRKWKKWSFLIFFSYLGRCLSSGVEKSIFLIFCNLWAPDNIFVEEKKFPLLDSLENAPRKKARNRHRFYRKKSSKMNEFRNFAVLRNLSSTPCKRRAKLTFSRSPSTSYTNTMHNICWAAMRCIFWAHLEKIAKVTGPLIGHRR